MSKSPLVELHKAGQSFWLDNISRGLIKSGELERMIREEGLRGVTSNPSIFYKSIKTGTEYDATLKALAGNKDLSEKDIFYELAIQDIKDAADILMPVYEESGGTDGFISMEVDPSFAYKTADTVKEAEYIFERIGRKNLMVKVPATKEGLPAIKTLTGRGHNINVTLLFSVKRYEEVTNAYIEGLEQCVKDNVPLHSVSSVASFFVSRVDTLTDRYLNEDLKNTDADKDKDKIRSLFGKTAVANAKMAYQVFKNVFSAERFMMLKQKGAHIQRLLWGSTSTKNPDYDDLLYVEPLIGPNTVNTMPDATITAFKDHGKVERTVDRDMEDVYNTLTVLDSLDIDIEGVTEELEDEGVRLFKEAFDSLLALIKEKREQM